MTALFDNPVAAAAMAVFVFQGAVILVDEFYYHHKRGLGRWERIGHPADMLTVLLCFAVVWTLEPTPGNIKLYIGLALFSCVFITKDEFVHVHLCPPGEMWLHAFLFVLHPLTLATLGGYWLAAHGVVSGGLLPPAAIAAFRTFLVGQTAIVVAFWLYQILYWNVAWTRRK